MAPSSQKITNNIFKTMVVLNSIYLLFILWGDFFSPSGTPSKLSNISVLLLLSILFITAQIFTYRLVKTPVFNVLILFTGLVLLNLICFNVEILGAFYIQSLFVLYVFVTYKVFKVIKILFLKI